MAPCKIMTVSVNYSFYDRMNILLADSGANVIESNFSDVVNIKFSIKADNKDVLADKLTQQSNGKYSLKEIGEKFAKV